MYMYNASAVDSLSCIILVYTYITFADNSLMLSLTVDTNTVRIRNLENVLTRMKILDERF